jgi:preprotein translocase subunit SecG
VLGTTAFLALAFLIAVLAISYIAANVERARLPHAMPAE